MKKKIALVLFLGLVLFYMCSVLWLAQFLNHEPSATDTKLNQAVRVLQGAKQVRTLLRIYMMYVWEV